IMKNVSEYDEDCDSDGSSVIMIEPPVKKHRLNSKKPDLISVKPVAKVPVITHLRNSTKVKRIASIDLINKPKEKLPKLEEAKIKKFRCAYMLWLNENRKLITKPGMSVCDVSKAAGVQWNTLRAKDKSKWEKAAEEDRKRYDQEMNDAYKQEKEAFLLLRKPVEAATEPSKSTSSVDSTPRLTKPQLKFAEHWAAEFGADAFDPLVPTTAKTGLVLLSQTSNPDLEQLLWKFGLTWIGKQQYTRVWLLQKAYQYIQEHPDDIDKITDAVEPRKLTQSGDGSDPLVPSPSKGLLPLSQLSGFDLHWLLDKLQLPVLNGKLYASREILLERVQQYINDYPKLFAALKGKEKVGEE
ncbi:hypothetical protein PENTCL1PPCAC_7632, partial [Pristionchus entomophagus]